MLYLFLGTDTYRKHLAIHSLAKEKNAVLSYMSEDEMPQISKLLETDLFLKNRVFVFEEFPAEFLEDRNLEKLISAKNIILLNVVSLDKRKKENKDLLKNSLVKVNNFILPHGLELNQAIVGMVKERGGFISDQAVEELAKRLGRDSAREVKVGGKVIAVEECYSMWSVNSEIDKLIGFAKGSQISETDVKSLVSEAAETDVMDIINSIGEKNIKLAYQKINSFLQEKSSSDEKSSVIHLNALLSEQFRSIFIVQELLLQNLNDDKILDFLGWKPGRLFVVKKNAQRFNLKKIDSTLNKLAAMDEEIKTSQVSARLILDLILSQVI
ncbi:MAG: hypothetical protein JNN11_04255 [Candidatus Doudnabacteria bacterium]|nr:hypothetical protein [Candidatus Doudnabacteria bacterium]